MKVERDCEHDIACFVSEPGLRGLPRSAPCLVCGEDIVDAKASFDVLRCADERLRN
jgi:hypothetical protein